MKKPKSLELTEQLKDLVDLHTLLARSGYPIRVEAESRMGSALDWDGSLKASIKITDLGSTDIRRSLPLLQGDRVWVNWLGEAMLTSHLVAFELFIASLSADCYKKVVDLYRHNGYGFDLPPEAPDVAVFRLHISRVRDLINDDLKAAAAEAKEA